MTRTLTKTWSNMNLLILTAIMYIACTKANDIMEETKVLADTEKFSIDFFRHLQNSAGKNYTNNLIMSPLSAFDVVATYGVLETKSKPYEVGIGESSNTNMIDHQGFQNLVYKLHNAENVKLKIANNMCINNQIQLKSDLRKLADSVSVFKTCELDVTEPNHTVTRINEWVSDKTNNVISKILQPGDITNDVQIIILNAIYFEGLWKNQFKERSTKYRPFYVNKNRREFVSTMSNIDSYMYGNLPDLKAKFVEIPYANPKLKMTVIVPNEIDGLKDIVENLESFNQTRLSSSGSQQNVYVMLPKFKIETSIDVKAAFEQIGLDDMLKAKDSMTTVFDKSVFMDKIIQKAVIEVKEDGFGGTSSLDTIDTMKRIHSVIAANRPFLFQIINDETKMTLFIGFVTNPRF